jgi:hypothetical protein
VADGWLTTGSYDLVVAGATLPATLTMVPLVDPEGARIKC